MTLTTGDLLQARYRIGARLGQGGMGAVYRGYDTRLEVPVALKEMVPQPGLDVQALDRLRAQFGQEARVLARLRHPYLVRVSDFFIERDNAYLVMDFVEGEALATRIVREGAQSETRVIVWAEQLLNALAYCHAQGVIHRDVKPQNVIIDATGKAILVDFGLVKLWDISNPETQTAVRGMGTLEYAPPEQYSAVAGHTDPRSDLYSLGSTMYHALTGQAPPTATDRMADPETFVSVRKLNPDVTPGTEAVIVRAMALPRAVRFPDARAMAAALAKPTTVLAADTPSYGPVPATRLVEEGLRGTGDRAGETAVVPAGAPAEPQGTVLWPAAPGTSAGAPVTPEPLSQSTPPSARKPEPVSESLIAVPATPRRRWARTLAAVTLGVVALAAVAFGVWRLVDRGGGDAVTREPVAAPVEERPVSATPRESAPRLDVIRVATTPDQVPMTFFDAGGRLVGYEIDLMREIGEHVGFGVEIIELPREVLFERLLAGEVDAVVACVTITEERQRRLAFSNPYFNAGQVIVVSADPGMHGGEPIRGRDDLRGRVVGVQAGSPGEEVLARIGEVDVRVYDEPDVAFEHLAVGELNAVLYDLLTTSRILYERRGMDPLLEVVSEPLTEELYGIILHPENPELLTRINEGLDSVHQDKALIREMAERWLP